MPRKRVNHIKLCDWCGNIIGAERGPASKTCSPECQRDRNSAREKERYQRVKDSEEWKATRKDYIQRVKERRARDPEFAERLTMQHREVLRKFRQRLLADPERLEAYREKQRQWHRNLSPEKRAAKKYWYGSLSPVLKQSFLSGLREKRKRAA